MRQGGYSDREIRVLQRIVALLISLAGLCERAAALPQPLRGSVLWLLRPGEACIRRLFFGATVERDVPYSTSGDAPNDAFDLAERFLALAQALYETLQAIMVDWVAGPLRPARPHRSVRPAAAVYDHTWLQPAKLDTS